jgi:hypothetical protein
MPMPMIFMDCKGSFSDEIAQLEDVPHTHVLFLRLLCLFAALFNERPVSIEGQSPLAVLRQLGCKPRR